MKAILCKVLLIMAMMFFFAVPGFLMRKAKPLSPSALKPISELMLYYAQPMLIIEAFAIFPPTPSGRMTLNFLYVFLFALAVLLLMFGAAKLVFLYMKPEKTGERNVLAFTSVFSNCTFVGLPFVNIYTGGNSETMMYVVIFNVVINLLIWALGASLLTQDNRQISVRRSAPQSVHGRLCRGVSTLLRPAD